MAKEIISLLERIGYSYFKVDESIVIEDIIIQILLGKEKRLLKAIPFIIYITTKKISLKLNMQLLRQKAKEKKIVRDLDAILGVTKNILNQVDPGNPIVLILKRELPKNKESVFVFSFDEYLYDFIAQKKLYEAEQQISVVEKMNKSKEYDFEYALQILFKPKQREIIKKIIDSTPLTKIEYDYYFKTIKKRLRAVKLLGEFADTLIQKKISKEG